MCHFMERLNQLIKESFRAYRFSTGINIFFIDDCFELYTLTENLSLSELKYLDFDEIFKFIKENLSEVPAKQPEFHTYYTKNNFIYNIFFSDAVNKSTGAIVAGPMLISYPTEDEINNLSKIETNEIISKNILTSKISNISQVSFVRIFYSGTLLTTLFNFKRLNEKSVQKIHGRTFPSQDGTITYTELRNFNNTNTNLSENSSSRHLILMKNLIINGDINAVKQLINKIKTNPIEIMLKDTYDYSLKTNFIKICLTCCGIAIKGGAPYYKMMKLSDKFINKFEHLTTIDEIMALVCEIIECYTRAVANYSNKTYSRPVKDILHYIQSNYSKKITLNELSKAANLSTFYISRLIKKETGLSITDNINKIRIDESKFLLKNTNESILNISQVVGFSYQNHFANIFKKFVGVSPNEFRNNQPYFTQKPNTN